MLNWASSASNNNQLCVTQTLSNIQTATGGTLTLTQLILIVSDVVAGQVSSLNGANLCTPCVKQMYNVAKNAFPAIFGQGTSIASDLQTGCGSSFVGELTFFHIASGWTPCSPEAD